LHKWKTNIASTQENGRLLDINRDHESKLLGVLWDPDEDVLYYKSPIIKFENSVTKRIILSEVARLFDPLGLVGPVITAAKILIQSVWACNIGWDDSVPIQYIQILVQNKIATVLIRAYKNSKISDIRWG